MKRKKQPSPPPPILDGLLEEWPDSEFLKVDGYDDCIIGVATRFGMQPILAYNRGKMLKKMMEEDGLSYEEASEYFDFNIIGTWMGDLTPIFIDLPST